MPTNSFEALVKADGDVESFREAGGWVDLLLSWYLGEVEVMSRDRIRSFARVVRLRHARKCSSEGAEIKNLSRGGPDLSKLLIGTVLTYDLGPSMAS